MPFIQFKEFITGNNLEWLREDENKKDRKIQFKIMITLMNIIHDFKNAVI